VREAVRGNGPADKAGTAPRIDFTTHVSQALGELVCARDWLTVFQLPPYASELNPVESVWSCLKRSLANLATRDIIQLTALVRTRLRLMQYRSGLLTGFLTGTRLDLTSLQ
jgi:transposase